MSSVLTDVVNVDTFAKLEKEFSSLYQAATQADAMALKANLAATVANHRLGVLANRLQPMVETTEGKGTWGAYLKSHGMAIRTVERAQRIARVMDEEAAAKLTLTQADDMAAETEAVERGNVSSVEEWRALKEKLAEAREDLDRQEESEREKKLAEFEKKLEEKANNEYRERAKELDAAAKKAREQVEAEAKAQADANTSAVTANEMAEALKAEEEGKASVPAPRAESGTMPPEVAAELRDKDEDEDKDEGEKEVVVGLLDDQQIDSLADRLREIVAERPSELKDAIGESSVQKAVDGLVSACHGEPEIAFAVMAVWFNDNGL